MKNKGFTLIELLAVIVILAVIALIAVPIILNVIEKARQGAAESSALGYVDAAEKQVMINKVKDEGSLLINEGEYTKSQLSEKNLNIKGDVTDALVLINNKGKVTQGRFCIDGYSIDYDGKEAKINKEEKYCEKILSILDPCEIPEGTEYTFDYTGNEQTFTASCNGKYKLEVWGAQGSTYVSSFGKGGYSVGVSALSINDTLYINVGGQGTGTTGGYNGGGNAGGRWNQTTWHEAADWGSGGGATHIALDSGLLSTLSAHATDGRILIVAGGGGGGEHWWSTSNSSNQRYLQGGHGGGYLGVNGVNMYGTDSQGGGQDETTGSKVFGQAGGGAGGGYYGGASSGTYSAGAGGSGYITSSNLLSANDVIKAMYCYGCTESSDPNTYTISTTGSSSERDTTSCPDGYSSNPVSKCAKTGNGYAKITYLGK